MKIISFLKFLAGAFLVTLGTMASIEKGGWVGGVLAFFIGVALVISARKWGIMPIIRAFVMVFTVLLRLVKIVWRLLISLLSLLCRAARFLINSARKHWRWAVTIAGVVGAIVFLLLPQISASIKAYGAIGAISIVMLLFTVMSKRRSLYHSKHSRRH